MVLTLPWTAGYARGFAQQTARRNRHSPPRRLTRTATAGRARAHGVAPPGRLIPAPVCSSTASIGYERRSARQERDCGDNQKRARAAGPAPVLSAHRSDGLRARAPPPGTGLRRQPEAGEGGRPGSRPGGGRPAAASYWLVRRGAAAGVVDPADGRPAVMSRPGRGTVRTL